MPLGGNEIVILRSFDEIERLRASNIIVAEILNELKGNVKTGVSTIDLERICEEEVRKRKVIPAFKGYRGYPYCICTSINEQVVHGMPSKRVLKGGDIVSIDLGILYNGYYGDSAVTVPVGRVSEEVNRLIDVAEKALYLGINEARVGSRLSDIGAAIQGYVEANGFSVVRDFVGHGIGQSLHEAPQVPNFGVRGKGLRLKAGMVLAIEPMINMGRCEVVILGDGWTAVTKDGSLSAHFEHSIAITDNEPYILSRL